MQQISEDTIKPICMVCWWAKLGADVQYENRLESVRLVAMAMVERIKDLYSFWLEYFSEGKCKKILVFPTTALLEDFRLIFWDFFEKLKEFPKVDN